MDNEYRIVIKNHADGMEYTVSIHPVIEISVVMPIATDFGKEGVTWEDKLQSWFALVADHVTHSLTANKIVKLVLQGKADRETLKFRKENVWIGFTPCCSLKIHPVRNEDGTKTDSAEKLYGRMAIDIPRLMREITHVVGDISKEEGLDEMKQMAFEAIVGVLANVEGFLPLNNGEGGNSAVPVWCDVVSDDGIMNCFHKANVEKMKNCVDIGVDMVIRKENWEWDVTERPNGYVREVILPLEELTVEQESRMDANNILVAHGFEEFLEVIRELVFSTELILK